MDSNGVKNEGRVSRRHAIRLAAGAALAGLTHAHAHQPPIDTPPQSVPPDSPVNPERSTPPWLAQESRAPVVDLRSPQVLHAAVADPVAVEEMLDSVLIGLTGEKNSRAAWHKILGSAERIVVKFNAVAASTLNTTGAMATAIVRQLDSVGYTPDKIALVEAPNHMTRELGCRMPASGWGETITVGGQPEAVANYWLEADAVINVPFIKTHMIAGMSGCLKNISHAIIRRPARYHANGCSPFVAEVWESPIVQTKLRLNLVNGLRIVFRNGPDAELDDIADAGAILASFDPLACDMVALGIIRAERRRRGLPDAIEAPSLLAAMERAIGRFRPAEIQHIPLTV
ncbi:MAG: DUF362 domain-containing protein [Phycisphaerales bacterium]|nr:DUF362 domain-containing protein [Phycisphaerales bacterium]